MEVVQNKVGRIAVGASIDIAAVEAIRRNVVWSTFEFEERVLKAVLRYKVKLEKNI